MCKVKNIVYIVGILYNMMWYITYQNIILCYITIFSYEIENILYCRLNDLYFQILLKVKNISEYLQIFHLAREDLQPFWKC